MLTHLTEALKNLKNAHFLLFLLLESGAFKDIIMLLYFSYVIMAYYVKVCLSAVYQHGGYGRINGRLSHFVRSREVKSNIANRRKSMFENLSDKPVAEYQAEQVKH
jgi:hypothetical protein